jgi:hypothetical protein
MCVTFDVGEEGNFDVGMEAEWRSVWETREVNTSPTQAQAPFTHTTCMKTATAYPCIF